MRLSCRLGVLETCRPNSGAEPTKATNHAGQVQKILMFQFAEHGSRTGLVEGKEPGIGTTEHEGHEGDAPDAVAASPCTCSPDFTTPTA